METKAKLLDIVRDIRTGEFRITLTVKEIPSGIENLQDRDLRLSLKRWTNKRSLTANAYYWVLVGKIAKALRRSEAWVHNWLLCDFGAPMIVDGKIPYVPIKESATAQLDVMESSLYHLKPTSYVYMDRSGDIVRDYQMLKGSSQYDTEEMQQLIDGAVSEAKELGIETLPTAEIERMMHDYEVNYNAR